MANEGPPVQIRMLNAGTLANGTPLVANGAGSVVGGGSSGILTDELITTPQASGLFGQLGRSSAVGNPLASPLGG